MPGKNVEVLSDRLVIYHGYHAHYCPGCQCLHRFAVNVGHRNSRGEVVRWKFGDKHGVQDIFLPTFSPSLLTYYTSPETGKQVTLCHSFTKNGKIEFLNDCAHKLKGQIVDIPTITEWPQYYFNEEGQIR